MLGIAKALVSIIKKSDITKSDITSVAHKNVRYNKCCDYLIL